MKPGEIEKAFEAGGIRMHIHNSRGLELAVLCFRTEALDPELIDALVAWYVRQDPRPALTLVEQEPR